MNNQGAFQEELYQTRMERTPKRKKSYVGLIIVVGTLTILVFILVTAVVALFVTNQLRADSRMGQSLLFNTSPLDMIEVDEVDPALALASLGGVAEADVIAAAIDKSRPETALSAVLFDPSLTDKESAGGFLLLAEAYKESAPAREKTIFSYKMAGLIATLSPDMPDTTRADLFIQAGEGLMDLEENILAKFYLDQAFIVAAKSPFLQAAHRRFILERLQKDYLGLGERDAARASLNLTANPPPLASPEREQSILPPSKAIPLPSPVQEAEANRWSRAQELAAILVERGGKAPQSATEALRQALIEEDRQKLPFYEAELATAAGLSKEIDVTVAKIEWLSTKYKVARRAYGMSLVPEWEDQVEQIRTELTKTYEVLFALYADLIVALPEVSQIDKATEERLRREVLAGELGRYPNYPEEQRQKQLLDATAVLMTSQPEIEIFVGVGTVEGQEMYLLTIASE